MGQDHVSLPKKWKSGNIIISSFWSSFTSFNVQKYFHTCSANSLWKSRKSWKRANLSGGHKLHWQLVSQKLGCSFVLCVNQAATAHHKQQLPLHLYVHYVWPLITVIYIWISLSASVRSRRGLDMICFDANSLPPPPEWQPSLPHYYYKYSATHTPPPTNQMSKW